MGRLRSGENYMNIHLIILAQRAVKKKFESKKTMAPLLGSAIWQKIPRRLLREIFNSDLLLDALGEPC